MQPVDLEETWPRSKSCLIEIISSDCISIYIVICRLSKRQQLKWRNDDQNMTIIINNTLSANRNADEKRFVEAALMRRVLKGRTYDVPSPWSPWWTPRWSRQNGRSCACSRWTRSPSPPARWPAGRPSSPLEAQAPDLRAGSGFSNPLHKTHLLLRMFLLKQSTPFFSRPILQILSLYYMPYGFAGMGRSETCINMLRFMKCNQWMHPINIKI